MISVHIKKYFPEFTLQVDFDGANETIGLLGASGCGKTMTLQCIAGIQTPDEGHIEVDSLVLFDSKKKINLPPQKRKVGLLFQNYALFPAMTVEENILAGLHLVKDKSLRKQKATNLLAKFHLEEVAHHYPSAISGGQAQRTALARILASEPRLLMLDEPFSALDETLRFEMEQEIRRILKDFPGTTLFVSHNRGEVYRLCEKVCPMEQGKTEPMVTVKELFESPQTKTSARISGCRNIFPAERLDEHHIFLPDFSLELFSETAVPSDTHYTGFHSHGLKISSRPQKGTYSCEVVDVTEDIFSYLLRVRLSSGSPEILVELPKEEWETYQQKKNLFLEIPPEAILFLS